LAGLTPRELDGALDFGPARTVCPVGGEFADGEGPCGLPLDKIDPRHILEVREGDILPPDQDDEFYAKEFLKAFGIKGLECGTLLKIPGTGFLRLPVSIDLLTDKDTGELKANKNGRGPYMRLLAETIKNPFEAWWVPVTRGEKQYEALRLIRLFREPDGGEIGGLGVFHWLPGEGWQGATAFKPKAANFQGVLRYLEKQRSGLLLYREK
jgi:hypothetical protein